jgi:hypothetical protein
MRRLGILSAAVLAWTLVVPAPHEASAEIRGKCLATLAGQPIASGHNTPESAIRATVADDIDLSGTAGQDDIVLSAGYGIEFAGILSGTSYRPNGERWSFIVPTRSLSRLAVGLFLVRLDIKTLQGTCTGEVYVCLTGRNPLFTALGVTSAAVAVIGLFLTAATLRRLRQLSPVRGAVQVLFGEAMATAAAGALLQQSCLADFDLIAAAVVPLGAGVVGSALVATLSTIAGGGSSRP